MPVTWEDEHGGRLKALGWNDASFLPGPAEVLLKLSVLPPQGAGCGVQGAECRV